MARNTAAPEIYVARSTGVIKIDGKVVTYTAGQTRVRAGHPLLKAVPAKFKPLDLHYDLEDATATPGRKRGA
ncbi:MAG TPA: hypothetical protein VF377_12255 [Acidimicrobiia bacterium]